MIQGSSGKAIRNRTIAAIRNLAAHPQGIDPLECRKSVTIQSGVESRSKG